MAQKDDKFLQPIISVLGLAISIISTLLPLFTKEGFTKLFINQQLAQPISFVAFILGIVIIWQITELQIFIQIPIGPIKDRGRGYKEPWKIIDSNGLVWILLFFNLVFSLSFLYLNIHFANVKKIDSQVGLLQGLFYLLFFLDLITVFSIQLVRTKQKFKWSDDKENLIQTITNALEKNGLINSGIVVLENRELSSSELQQLNISGVGLVRKVKIKVISQTEQITECIISNDGKQVLKVV